MPHTGRFGKKAGRRIQSKNINNEGKNSIIRKEKGGSGNNPPFQPWPRSWMYFQSYLSEGGGRIDFSACTQASRANFFPISSLSKHY